MKGDYVMKQTKLYNMIFPPFMLTIIWPISTVGNLIIDSLVVTSVLLIFRKLSLDAFGKVFLRLWLWGYVSDAIGAVLMLIVSEVGKFKLHHNQIEPNSLLFEILNSIDRAVTWSSLDSIWGIMFIILGILIAAISIFLFDYNLVFKKHLSNVLTKKQMIIASLSMAIFTAPYTFFLPKELVY
jgi:hypothetical protein